MNNFLRKGLPYCVLNSLLDNCHYSICYFLSSSFIPYNCFIPFRISYSFIVAWGALETIIIISLEYEAIFIDKLESNLGSYQIWYEKLKIYDSIDEIETRTIKFHKVKRFCVGLCIFKMKKVINWQSLLELFKKYQKL